MYRVVQHRIRFGDVTTTVHGPYSSFLRAWFVGMWVCGDWDEIIIQEKT